MDQSPHLPAAQTIPSLSTTEQKHILDLLFEPSPVLHDLALPILSSQHFTNYNDLIAAIGTLLFTLAHATPNSSTQQSQQSKKQQLLAILGSHPRLGAKRVDSAQSAAEQAQLQAGAAAAEQAEQLQQLNAEYERAFPGLRYVVFVNGRGRNVIMEDMRRRIDKSKFEDERDAAIQAMCDIANDRAAKLQ